VPSPTTLLVFAAASALLAAVPGPNVLFVLASGLAGGRRAAVRSVFGVHAATLCFVAAAACGLTALLASSALAFAVVKYAGAAYLIVLGVRALRSGADPVAPPAGDGRAFRQAFAVGISNPKVALFLAAFLPQFGSSAAEVLVLGVVFLVVAVTLDLGWALLAGALGRWLRRHPRALRRQRWITGPTYLGLGTYAALRT
jgi:threonine/homoserine/homoserine lactone efflux protein